MLPHHLRAALLETRAIYAQADQHWQPFSCPGTAECCQLAMTKRPPWVWPSEWATILEALKRTNRTLPEERADGGCPLLDPTGKRCTVYADRPLGCRTFFCHRIEGPARQPLEAMNAMLKRLEALNRRLDEDAAPRPLPEWFERPEI